MIIRKAELKDAALLSETRKLQLIDEGIAPDCDIDSELENFFKKRRHYLNLNIIQPTKN
jgi:hypothetical protein